MKPTPIMINGLPGKVAKTLIPHFAANEAFTLIPWSLTGPDTGEEQISFAEITFGLLTPANREEKISAILAEYPGLVTIDYTHPLAVNDNAAFYCRHKMPFVMGTTGGDREALVRSVTDSATCAVIAPNMAKQIVGFQAIMAFAGETFPDLFKGYTLTIAESHQAAKADTSGTAKAMVGHFNKMGLDFSVSDIQMERDPQAQKTEWGIPEDHLEGHAWHTYTLTSPDGNALFRFQHNINGRDIYAPGTMDAVRYLTARLQDGNTGAVYSMIDVLKGT